MDYYQKNIEALRQHQPQLVDLIETTEEDDKTARILMSTSGEPGVVWRGEGGEESNIHSSADPVHCAGQAIDLMDRSEKEGIFVLLGFGLGYLAEELLKHFETGHAMLIYEATPLLFKTALRARDLTRVFASARVRVVVGEDGDDFSIIHNYHHYIVNGKCWVVAHKPSKRLNEGAYDRFQKRLENEKRISLSGVATVIGLGKDFVNAFLQNVPSLLHEPGVTSLRNVFEGRPAIVVSAGPSLDRNLHLLRKAKSKALIVAVDAALPPLVSAGILPDVLVAIDPLNNMGMFRDNPQLKEVPLVCLVQYTPEIVKMYPGPLFMNMVEGNVAYQWLRGYWEEKGCIACFGGSVSHLAFAVAEFMGGSTICLMGLDLSFEEKFHAGDTTQLMASEGGVEVPDYRIGAETAQDIFGEKRYTLPTFLTFRTSFENRIKSFPGLVFNATEGGLPVAGTENIRLADFIEEFCDLPGIDTFKILSGLADTEVGYDIEGLLHEIKEALDRFREIKKHARQILKYIEGVRDLRTKGREESEEFHRILDKIERLTTKVRHPALNLIAAYHYQLELYLKRQAVMDVDQMEDKLERLDAQLERGLNYYTQLLEAIDLFVKELERLGRNLGREQKINRILRDETTPEMERLYTVGMASRKAGRVTMAVKYLEALRRTKREKLLSGDQTHSGSESVDFREPDFLLAELYIRQYRYYEARELLEGLSMQGWQGRTTYRENGVTSHGSRVKKKPLSIIPGSHDDTHEGFSRSVDGLLQVCRGKIRAWEDRKARMGDLLKKAEESYGGSLESGLFYFRVENCDRALKAYLDAIKEHSNGQSPQLVAAFYGLAHTYLKLKENQKAVDAFAGALKIDPGNPLIYRDLALLAIETGNADSGEMFLTKALELAPWSDELYTLLARLYLSLNEGTKAITLYEYGIQRNPQNASLQKELALLYQDVILQRKN